MKIDFTRRQLEEVLNGLCKHEAELEGELVDAEDGAVWLDVGEVSDQIKVTRNAKTKVQDSLLHKSDNPQTKGATDG